MTDTSAATGILEIRPKFFFLAFLLMIFKPKASIDGGAPITLTWGVNPIPVPAGRHRVDVWLPYLFLSEMGKNGTEVDVPAGGAVQVRWNSPWLVFLKGRISVRPAEGAAG
jgi:hypothetical protein